MSKKRNIMIEKLHPYVVFLPTEKKDKILSAIFGSKAGVDLLKILTQTRHIKKHLPKRTCETAKLLKQDNH